MLFQAAIPPGPPGTPETFYTGLALGEDAVADRPYVICNFVSSADGKATARGRTALLGGEGDRAMFHLLRTQVDAVLAGTGTLRVERYGTLIREPRLVDIRVSEGRAPQPIAVVISRSGHIPFDIPLFASAESRVVVYAPSGVAVPACAAQVTVHELPAVAGELAGVLRSLRNEHGVRSLLCEGGPTLFTALLAHDLVDELFLTLAPTIVGGEELGITSEPLAELIQLRLVRVLEHGGTLFMRYARA
ncbi:MAG: dihydrofolate reductase family protein [Solirubrobacteraceae bacterium]